MSKSWPILSLIASLNILNANILSNRVLFLREQFSSQFCIQMPWIPLQGWGLYHFPGQFISWEISKKLHCCFGTRHRQKLNSPQTFVSLIYTEKQEFPWQNRCSSQKSSFSGTSDRFSTPLGHLCMEQTLFVPLTCIYSRK